jgi:hypothetical protein
MFKIPLNKFEKREKEFLINSIAYPLFLISINKKFILIIVSQLIIPNKVYKLLDLVFYNIFATLTFRCLSFLLYYCKIHVYEPQYNTGSEIFEYDM